MLAFTLATPDLTMLGAPEDAFALPSDGRREMFVGRHQVNRESGTELGGLSAVGFAALYGHYEVFAIKKLTIPVDHPAARDLLRYGCSGDGLPIIEKLLRQGLDPNDQDNGGCSAIQQLLERLEWYRGRDLLFSAWNSDRGGDSEGTREKIKAAHLLAKHGARWRPSDTNVKAARRSLLKMTPKYTVEFAWIMQKYGGCAKEEIESLIKTPAMKRHLSRHMGRPSEILGGWPKPLED